MKMITQYYKYCVIIFYCILKFKAILIGDLLILKLLNFNINLLFKQNKTKLKHD
jgi:hypothetical protein